MICFYLFFEYVRPQSIIPELDFLPWTQLSLIGALIGLIFEPTKKWVSSPVNKLLIVFLLTIFLSIVNAYWPDISLVYLKNMYVWVIVYFLIINIITTRKRFLIFLAIFVLASFKISLSLAITWAKRGFSFTDWGLQGPPGFFQNSGELAIQMAIFWPIAFSVTLYFKAYISNLKYCILLTMPISAIMVILGASSRGAQLALLVQFIAGNFRRIFKIKVILFVFVALYSAWWLLPPEQKDRFEIAGEDRTSQQRLLYWQNGIDMMNEHPFFGVGYFNFIPYYNINYSSDLLRDSAELPHNIFVQIGSELGYTGLVIYLLFIFFGFKTSLDARKNFARDRSDVFFKDICKSANISFIGFLVAGQFVSVAYYPFMWIHLALLVSLRNISVFEDKTKNLKYQ
ncbi:hypothetical protein ACP86_00060 [Marinobacter sp. CP1]|jgi:O-antigen ligase|nr:hypothetical protein ACP86_00060 [Marinobacter sp. CP1]